MNRVWKKVASFLKTTWKVVTYKKIVFVALTIFIAIILFAALGPLFLRAPFDQVRVIEPVDHVEQFTVDQNYISGNVGQFYNVSGRIPLDVENTNSSDNTFYISGKMRVWEDGGGGSFVPLTGTVNFQLWRGNITTFQANDDLLSNQTVEFNSEEAAQNYVVEFELNVTAENLQSPYVISFSYLGNEEFQSGTIFYTLETDVIWITVQENLQVLSPPTWNVLSGTDEFGHDTFAQLAHSTRNSLLVGFMAGIIATLAAVIVGAVSGYLGGYLDDFTQLVVNIIMVFPVFPLLLILAAFVEQRSLGLVAVIIAVTSWPWAARAIRSQILSLKERDFVRLAKISGKNGFVIAIKELLPNMASYILLIFAIQVGSAIGAEAGISLLGFGPDPRESITLGSMLFWVIGAESVRSGFWWLYLPPGLILTILFVILYILQSNLDEIFNPRLRSE